jgi:hypothetical protein
MGLSHLTDQQRFFKHKVLSHCMGRTESMRLGGQIKRIGGSAAFLYAKDDDGKSLLEQYSEMPDRRVALKLLLEWLQSNALGRDLDAVGRGLSMAAVRNGRGTRLCSLPCPWSCLRQPRPHRRLCRG